MLSADDSGGKATPEGIDKCVKPLLPFDSGRGSPVSVFEVDTFDMAAVVMKEPHLSKFMEDHCPEDPQPPPLAEELDDNHSLDFGSDASYCSELEDICSPDISPVGLPWSSTDVSEAELLATCVNEVDPASRAL